MRQIHCVKRCAAVVFGLFFLAFLASAQGTANQQGQAKLYWVCEGSLQTPAGRINVVSNVFPAREGTVQDDARPGHAVRTAVDGAWSRYVVRKYATAAQAQNGAANVGGCRLGALAGVQDIHDRAVKASATEVTWEYTADQDVAAAPAPATPPCESKPRFGNPTTACGVPAPAPARPAAPVAVNPPLRPPDPDDQDTPSTRPALVVIRNPIDSSRDAVGTQYGGMLTNSLQVGKTAIPPGSTATLALAKSSDGKLTVQLVSFLLAGKTIPVTAASGTFVGTVANPAQRAKCRHQARPFLFLRQPG